MNVAQKLTSGIIASAAILGMITIFNQVATASPNPNTEKISTNLTNATAEKIETWLISQEISVSVNKSLKTKDTYNIQLNNATPEQAVTIFAQILGQPITKLGTTYYIGKVPTGPLKSGGHIEPAPIPTLSYTL